MLLVVTHDWESTSGNLRRFERATSGDRWQQVDEATQVIVGKSGLAWGMESQSALSVDGPTKREGDGKSPSGAFQLLSEFGIDSSPSSGLPYIAISSSTVCVDDVESKYYNQIIDANSVSKRDWNSGETMLTYGHGIPYKRGLVIGYNTELVPGKGSCIFLHVWHSDRSPTEGCTAMRGAKLDEISKWITPRKKPLFVQLTKHTYSLLKTIWALP